MKKSDIKNAYNNGSTTSLNTKKLQKAFMLNKILWILAKNYLQ